MQSPYYDGCNEGGDGRSAGEGKCHHHCEPSGLRPHAGDGYAQRQLDYHRQEQSQGQRETVGKMRTGRVNRQSIDKMRQFTDNTETSRCGGPGPGSRRGQRRLLGPMCLTLLRLTAVLLASLQKPTPDELARRWTVEEPDMISWSMAEWVDRDSPALRELGPVWLEKQIRDSIRWDYPHRPGLGNMPTRYWPPPRRGYACRSAPAGSI